MTNNHVAANLLMAFFLVGGILASRSLKVEIFPEVELDRVSVSVAYPGAGPREVEDGIIRPIEEAIHGLDGVKRVVANASEGGATVIAELLDSADNDEVLQDIKSAVDRIITFPQDAERPVVKKMLNRTSVLSVAVHGEVPRRGLRQRAETLRDELLALPEITQAEVSGIPDYEISIEVSEQTLRRYGLTLERVAAAVRRASLDLPGGALKASGGEILLRTKERRYTAREYEEVIVLSQADGTLVHLRDIATVRESFAETDEAGVFDGKPAVMVDVFRVGNQSPTAISKAVRAYIKSLDASAPIKLAVWGDRSEILQQRIDLLVKNARLGLALVVIVIGLFMQLRLAFWVTLGIPISVLGAMMMMPAFDVSINMISLFAFILVLGIVVDDAIVVGENIYSHQQRGVPYTQASIDGALEVGRPVVFSVLTTIAAFAPLLMVSGTIGKFMRAIPVIVISVLAVSLVESLFVLPAHLNRKGATTAGKSRFGWYRFFGGLLQRLIDGPYRRLLTLALHYRYATLALAVVSLLLTVGLFAGGFIKMIFLPDLEGDVVRAQLSMPVGTPVAQTKTHVQRMVVAAQQLVAEYDAKRPQGSILRNIYARVGSHFNEGGPRGAGSSGSGGHLADISVFLVESGQRQVESGQFARAWRKRVGEIAGAESLEYKSTIVHMGSPVDIQLSASDFSTLELAAERLKDALRDYPGIYDVTDSYEAGKRELKLRLLPGARALGITERDLGRQVRSAFYGEEALRLQRERNEVRVMVRYPLAERRGFGNIDSMRIRTASGGEIPFSQAARIEEGRGYSLITRVDRKRVVSVKAKANLRKANPTEIVGKLKETVLPQLMADYPGLSYNLEGEQKEQSETMGGLFRGLLAALLVIFALLAIPSHSYAQPLIIMSAVPFGIIGAVLGHLLLGYNLSMMSFFGVVALAGVVVNDSLVLVDFINRLRSPDRTIFEAVVQAGRRRFRPILLTTLTTFFALVPMLAETSMQARFLIPMAISLAFGVLGATVITLILVPTLYLVLEDIKQGIRWLFARPAGPATTLPEAMRESLD